MTIRIPSPHRRAGLPDAVRIYEVGPRDGLQNEASIVAVDIKLEFVSRLVAAGLTTVEATSFVSPKWIPQLGDAEELFPQLPRVKGARYPVLVPNLAGLQRARAAGATDIAVFAAATESFSRRNLNRSLDEALAMFAPVVAEARADGMWVRSYLSMCFGDPWEGEVPVGQVVEVALRLLEQGSQELCVADTIGVATPGHVQEVLGVLDDAGVAPVDVAVHFHDTYGQALSNTLAALEAGVRTVDSSAGGLGGCPYAKSATGNLATEDLVWMLHGLGIETGVDLESLLATSVWMAAELGRPSPSRVVRALGEVPASGERSDDS
jgi:hydroxymethylglutaryl-CoA lyase